MRRAENKVVIVTGGALGIGRETCILLAKEGAKVAITDILDLEGKKLAEEINQSGNVAKFWHLDVAKENEVERVFAEVAKVFGKIDANVNNAGITGVDKPIHEISEKEWDTVMNVNVKGVFFCTKHAIARMKKSDSGSIINLSSIYGLVGAGDIPPFHASKEEVRLLSKNDAVIYATENIRVISVHPELIWSPLVEELGKNSSGFNDNLDSQYPIGHIGKPIDIAFGILYLISDESCLVTESELVLDSGYRCNSAQNALEAHARDKLDISLT